MRCSSLIGWEVTFQTYVSAAFIVLLHGLHREKRGLYAISAIEFNLKSFGCLVNWMLVERVCFANPTMLVPCCVTPALTRIHMKGASFWGCYLFRRVISDSWTRNLGCD